jgi:anthranilate phosphoribosyltransferase
MVWTPEARQCSFPARIPQNPFHFEITPYSVLVLEQFTVQLSHSEALTPDQIAGAVTALADERVAPSVKAAFLTALARKGESVAEITAFARQLRSMSVQPPLSAVSRQREILDVCGTGGDRLNTFNISTTVAIICAAAGVTVAKHGNRAVTSQAGSADVLDALGVAIDLAPEHAARALDELGFAFFFALRRGNSARNAASPRSSISSAPCSTRSIQVRN